MFRHPAQAVGSSSSGLTAARTVGSKSTGGSYRCELSPCTLYIYQFGVKVGVVGAVDRAAAEGDGGRAERDDGREECDEEQRFHVELVAAATEVDQMGAPRLL